MIHLAILLCCLALFAAGYHLGRSSVLIELKSYGFSISKGCDNKLIVTLKKQGSTFTIHEKRDAQ